MISVSSTPVVILLCLIWAMTAVYIATRLLPDRDEAIPAHPLTGRLATKYPDA